MLRDDALFSGRHADTSTLPHHSGTSTPATDPDTGGLDDAESSIVVRGTHDTPGSGRVVPLGVDAEVGCRPVSGGTGRSLPPGLRPLAGLLQDTLPVGPLATHGRHPLPTLEKDEVRGMKTPKTLQDPRVVLRPQSPFRNGKGSGVKRKAVLPTPVPQRHSGLIHRQVAFDARNGRPRGRSPTPMSSPVSVSLVRPLRPSSLIKVAPGVPARGICCTPSRSPRTRLRRDDPRCSRRPEPLPGPARRQRSGC